MCSWFPVTAVLKNTSIPGCIFLSTGFNRIHRGTMLPGPGSCSAEISKCAFSQSLPLTQTEARCRAWREDYICTSKCECPGQRRVAKSQSEYKLSLISQGVELKGESLKLLRYTLLECMDASITQTLSCVLWVLTGSRANNFLMAGGKDFYNLTIMFRELAYGTTVCRHFGISCLSGFSSFTPPTATGKGRTANQRRGK